MDLTQALAYIHSVSWRGSRPGLERTRALLARMGDPQKQLQFIHIAGTNGKGSTAAMLASVFTAAGYCTGLYTSPYLLRFHERMQVNGQPISDGELIALVESVRPLADACPDPPTEFELVTCLAMEFFRRRGCRIVILEVGMGGALDSTNVIDTPVCAVLCNIGLDHTKELGATLPEIARTKAGICKPGGLCVTYPAEPAVQAVYDELAQARRLELHRADFSRLRPLGGDLTGQRFDFGPWKDLCLPLLGPYQRYNAAVALTVLELLAQRGWRISEPAIRDGLANVRWPGRFELLHRRPLFFVDGGHNPQCVEALAENLRTYFPGRRFVFLTGVMADKDYTQMYRRIAPLAERFFTVTPPNPRALDAAALAALLSRLGQSAEAVPDLHTAVRRTLDAAGPDGVAVAFGSLYMVGPLRQILQTL